MNYLIEVEPGHYNLSPKLFHEYARQYLQCERTFKTDAVCSPVPYFLVCRAMELALKAQHLESKSRDDIKKEYGHNLKTSYDELPSDNKTLDATEYDLLVRANAFYKGKGFEYVSVGDAGDGLGNFPDLGLLRRIAGKLVKDCQPSL